MRAVVRTAVEGEADALAEALGAPAGVYAGLGGRVLLVAEVGGRSVGAVVLRMDPGPEISDLQVHPDERGRGFGTALVEEACARAAAAGHPRVAIEAADPRAARLYRRLGFTGTAGDGVVRRLVRELG